MSKHKITLVTGISAVVNEITPKEQRILSAQGKQTGPERITSMLSSLIDTVGETCVATMSENEQAEFINNMLSVDKKKILIAARQISLGDDTEFTFVHEYKNKDGKMVKQDMEVAVDEDGFTEKPMYQFDPKLLENFTTLTAFKKQLKASVPIIPVYTDYPELLKNIRVELVLPKSQKKVSFRFMNGQGEKMVQGMKKSEMSSHLALTARNLIWHSEHGPISFQNADLDHLPLIDIEVLRLVVKYVEPRIDTELQLEHPEDSEDAGGQPLVIDLTTELAFFYPSGAM